MINKLLRKFTPYQITSKYLYRLDSFSLNLITYFTRMYDKVKHLEGDIVECGVGKGRSFMIFTFLSKGGKNVVGYDSFKGFPEPTIKDLSNRNPKKGEWSGTSILDVHTSLKVSYIRNTLIALVDGFFDQTIQRWGDNKIALLHLDCDLYESYKICLKYLYPKVVKGGVILFDDYNYSDWPGATKAVDEYGIKPLLDEESGKYYFIK